MTMANRCVMMDNMLLNVANHLSIKPKEWIVLMDICNGTLWAPQYPPYAGIEPSRICLELHDKHELGGFKELISNDQFYDLLRRIEAMDPWQCLALVYRCHYLWDLPDDERNARIG